jgi:polysaccharide deacetylase 2 family uncharacterized protein YibQ
MASSNTRKKSGKDSPRFPVTALIVVAVVVLSATIWHLVRGDGDRITAPFDARLLELAAGRGVPDDAISADDPIRKVGDVFVRTWRFGFPNQAARDGFLGDLELEAAQRGASLAFPEELGRQTIDLQVGFEVEVFDLQLSLQTAPPPVAPRAAQSAAPTAVPTPMPKPQPAPDARGRLAILLDDGGQKLDLVPAAAALPTEVGFAILPFLPKSTDTATALHQAGHEIWLHLPMEPQNYPTDDPGPGAVLMSMTASELRAAVHSAINNIPHAVGVNNHMGSKASADLKTMTWIMQELKVRNLAFIDSRTTVRTVAEEAAKAQGVPTNRRHVFLDNERSPAAIRKQLDEAVFRSRMEGEIIAIGHIDEVTIAVLSEELPGLAKRKADLVKPSDLVR